MNSDATGGFHVFFDVTAGREFYKGFYKGFIPMGAKRPVFYRGFLLTTGFWGVRARNFPLRARSARFFIGVFCLRLGFGGFEQGIFQKIYKGVFGIGDLDATAATSPDLF